jgi:type I restriction enzyme S subunit
MELSTGYKPTDFGLIPFDWDLKKIGTDIDLLTGCPFPSSGYSETGVRLLRGSNVKRGITDWTPDITQHWPSVSSDYAKYALDVGDLVIAMDGSLVGRSFARLAADDLPALLLQRVARIRSKNLSVSYLTAFVGSDWFIRYVDSVKTVTAIPHISPSDIAGFSIPVPPTYDEQERIATALSDVDALIAGLEKLITKKRDLKQAAMQQLLTGQTRLPGFSGEWARNDLKNLVSTPITDGPHLTPTFYETGVPFLSVNNLANNRIDWSDLRFISKADDEIFSRKCKPRKGDVLLGKAASVGKVAIVEDDFDFNIWSPIALIRSNAQVDAKFLYYQLLSADCITQVMLLTNSSSQGNIGMGDIEKIQISYPDLEEQTAIAKVLSDMDAELTVLESRITKTRDLKQGMMQELLTGRTRLVCDQSKASACQRI